MTDVKINVSANVDFGGVTSAMDKIRSSGEQPIKIGIDNKEAISNIDEVAKAQDAARIKASGTTSASSSVETPAEIIRKREMRQYKEYNDEVRRHFNLKRDVTELEYKSYQASANRMAKSGSSLGVFASASNGDARALAGLSPEAFRHAVANTGIIGKQPAERGGSSGAYGGKLASGLAGMAGGAIMGGTGGDGASAAGGALGGMIGAALPVPGGAFIGSMLGSMAGGAIGGSVGSAKDEAVGVSDLRHMLGETKTDFDLLRDSTRAAATGLGIAYGESVKLARQFAQTSSAQNGDSLGAEVRIASGLARSLGLDPSSGVGVMGTLRNTRATEDEAGIGRCDPHLGHAGSRRSAFGAAERLEAESRVVERIRHGWLLDETSRDYSRSWSSTEPPRPAEGIHRGRRGPDDLTLISFLWGLQYRFMPSGA